ncbi:MAG: hypothetical protein WDO24_03705 [Pseudomonadota bacterium]
MIGSQNGLNTVTMTPDAALYAQNIQVVHGDSTAGGDALFLTGPIAGGITIDHVSYVASNSSDILMTFADATLPSRSTAAARAQSSAGSVRRRSGSVASSTVTTRLRTSTPHSTTSCWGARPVTLGGSALLAFTGLGPDGALASSRFRSQTPAFSRAFIRRL